MSRTNPIGELYRSHGAAVLRRARRLLANEADAQELLQEVFTTLLRDPQLLIRARSAMALLYTITTNRALNRIRNEQNRRRLLHLAPEAAPAPTPAAPPDTHDDLRTILRLLPEQEAAAFVYRHVDGMTHTEIADLLGCSRRHVATLLDRSRERLLSHEHAP